MSEPPLPLEETPHRLVNPESLPPPSGYSHAVVAAEGTPVFLGGQTGHRPDGSIDDDLVDQFRHAAWNVAEALRAAGGRPEHLVHMTIYVTDVAGYRASLERIGEAYREHFGRHFPAMALIGASELVDAAAKVELVAVAVIPG